MIGEGGVKAFRKLQHIMEGIAQTPTLFLPDGKMMRGEPLVPTIAEQASAARDLLAYLLGKPVSQAEALTLDRKEAEESAALAAMDDETLFAKAREALGLKPMVEAHALPVKSAVADAEIVNDNDYIDEE